MGPTAGIVAAIFSSALGGTAAALTRYTIHASDPVTLAAFRFGIGFIPILAIALALGVRWPRGRDAVWVILLGVLFFSLFFVIYNVAMSYTSAARGSLALSMLPLTTMLVAALLGREALSWRKTAGVLIAVAGVAFALSTGLADAPADAWRGDLVMAAATLCMALYNVWSRPLMQRSSMLGFLASGMGAGALFRPCSPGKAAASSVSPRPSARHSGGRSPASGSSAALRRSTSGYSPSSARRRPEWRTR